MKYRCEGKETRKQKRGTKGKENNKNRGSEMEPRIRGSWASVRIISRFVSPRD